MSDSQRLENVENAVRALFREVVELREQVGRLSGTAPASAPVASAHPTPAPAAAPIMSVPPLASAERPSQPPSPALSGAAPPMPPRPASSGAPRPRPAATPRPAPSASTPELDVESLVGRYGTMALAALTIIMGVGAFLSWAVANVRLGPEARVALGALGALGVAFAGWRMRVRGARRFGNTLLGLALALVHVVAWGAGPKLGLVPAEVALAIAALASGALAALALRTREQPLFAVGVGGALLAPFSTSDGPGNVFVLLVFGWLVIALGIVALRPHRWRVAGAILGAGCATYAFAALGATVSTDSWLEQRSPVLFAFACTAGALAIGGPLHRARLGRAFLGVVLLAVLFASMDVPRGSIDVILFAIAGTVVTYGLLALPGTGDDSWTLIAALFPVGFLVAALAALDDPLTPRGALTALGWSVLAAGAAWQLGAARRPLHAVLAAIMSAAAIVLALHDRPEACVAALAAHASVAALLMTRLRIPLLAAPAVGVLSVASGWAWLQLVNRPAFDYRPFFTPESAAALAAVAAWWVVGRALARQEQQSATPRESRGAGALAPMVVAAFLWGREELAHAFSADLATFLLIGYYASTGIAAILVGRLRSLPSLRHLGLAVAIYAALKSVAQAYGFDSVGLRIGSYLLAGCFLLGVTYLYWAGAERVRAETAPG